MLYTEMIAVCSEVYSCRGVSSCWVLNQVFKQPLDLKRANYEYFKNTCTENENLSNTTRVGSLLTYTLSAKDITALQFMFPTALLYR